MKFPNLRVNWFREDENGRFIWPGFSQNRRVLSWIVDRGIGRANDAAVSPFGYMPKHDDINWEGPDFAPATFSELMQVDRDLANEEAGSQYELFYHFGDRLPAQILHQRDALKARLEAAPEVWRIDW